MLSVRDMSAFEQRMLAVTAYAQLHGKSPRIAVDDSGAMRRRSVTRGLQAWRVLWADGAGGGVTKVR